MKRGTLTNSIRLTAEFRAYQEIDVHAKVAGFIQSSLVDIGDQVKQGAIIATLEIPELDQDLKKAAAGVKAAHEEVNKAAGRLRGCASCLRPPAIGGCPDPRLVAQQDIDDVRAKDQAAAATLGNARQHVEQAEAEQSREMALVNYSKIIAPFDGVVTKRFADTGALAGAGARSTPVGDGSRPLCPARHPGRSVPRSRVRRSSGGIGRAGENRSNWNGPHLAGIRHPVQQRVGSRGAHDGNRGGHPQSGPEYQTGIYAWADLVLKEHKDVLYVPAMAISTAKQHEEKPVVDGRGPWPVRQRGAEENASVYLVTKDNRIEEREVAIGLQTPNQVEILRGLQEGDLVFIGHRSQVRPGQLVKPQVVAAEQIIYMEKK